MNVHHHPTPSDWDDVAQQPEFRELIAARSRFIIPATIFFLLYFLALPILVGFAPEVMSKPVAGPLTLAFVFALSQFVVAWLLLALYLRKAKRFDEMEASIATSVRKELAS